MAAGAGLGAVFETNRLMMVLIIAAHSFSLSFLLRGLPISAGHKKSPRRRLPCRGLGSSKYPRGSDALIKVSQVNLCPPVLARTLSAPE